MGTLLDLSDFLWPDVSQGRQPQSSATIDWNNPSTRDLVFAFEASHSQQNIVTGQYGQALGAGVTNALGSFGSQYNFSGSQANRSCAFGVFQGLSGATSATWDILAYIGNPGGLFSLFSQWDSGQQWLIQVSSNQLSWVAADDNSGNRRGWVVPASLPVAGWYRITLSWQGGASNVIMINGVDKTSAEINWFTAASNIGTNNVSDYLQLGVGPFTGAVAFARIWRRGLSLPELRILNDSPWQIFKSPSFPLFVPAAAGAGNAPGGTGTSTASGSGGAATGIIVGNAPGGTGVSTASGSGGVATGGSGSTGNAPGGTGVSMAAGSGGTAVGSVVGNAPGGVGISTSTGTGGAATGIRVANAPGGVGVSTASGSGGVAIGVTSAGVFGGTGISTASGSGGYAAGITLGAGRGGHSNVRSQQGYPAKEAFRSGSGTPIVVDINTGRLYVLRADEVIVDCLLLAESGVWDDLRFPAQSINPAGAAAPPAVSTDLTAFPGTLNFSGTALNIIVGAFQMPHAWQDGTDIHPHIHWMKAVAGAGAVGWQFKWRLMPIGGVAGAWSAWLDGVSAGINSPETASDTHFITAFPTITMTGLTDSVMVAWQLQRRGDTDAYNSIARLLEFDINYRVDRLGSEVEYPV